MKTKILFLAILAFTFGAAKAETFAQKLLNRSQYVVIKQTVKTGTFLGHFEASDGNIYEAYGDAAGNLYQILQDDNSDWTPLATQPTITIISGSWYDDGGNNYVDGASFSSSSAPAQTITFGGLGWL